MWEGSTAGQQVRGALLCTCACMQQSLLWIAAYAVQCKDEMGHADVQQLFHLPVRRGQGPAAVVLGAGVSYSSVSARVLRLTVAVMWPGIESPITD